ncbi:hypothetical protein KSX_74030 [Ktedonospora formicarum]|uniref:Uncharacterized protein n=1 Tax=Ktedonospora formicarum TaxID=2778364 RepID=A0A8J3MVE1_9CHLR|nr:hypothetical protein KSX_74030 [Ktedonospora formicarum]
MRADLTQYVGTGGEQFLFSLMLLGARMRKVKSCVSRKKSMGGGVLAQEEGNEGKKERAQMVSQKSVPIKCT